MGYCLGPDSMVYVLAGFNLSGYVNAANKYNTKTNTWTTLANVPTAVWYPAAATAPNGKIYLFGGENGYNLVQIYDPVANSWSSGTAIPTPVKGSSALLSGNGKIYLLGGMNASDVPIDSVQVYDPVANTWSRGTKMPVACWEFGFAVDQNGDMWCIGGKTMDGNGQAPFYNNTQIYTPSTDSWSTYSNIPHGLGETVAAFINNGINVFAGYDSVGYTNFNYRNSVLTNVNPVITEKDGFGFYPNPSNGNITLWMASSISENIVIRIYDITGKLMDSQTYSYFSGKQYKTLDLSSYSKGVYFIQYNTDKTVVTKKLVLQ